MLGSAEDLTSCRDKRQKERGAGGGILVPDREAPHFFSWHFMTCSKRT